MEVSSFIIGNKTLIHFEVSCYKLGNNGKVQLAYNSSENSGKAAEMLFLLTSGEEYLHHGKLNAYEVALGGRFNNINIGDLKLFERMNMGKKVGPQSYYDHPYTPTSPIVELNWLYYEVFSFESWTQALSIIHKHLCK